MYIYTFMYIQWCSCLAPEAEGVPVIGLTSSRIFRPSHFIPVFRCFQPISLCSMYGIFTNICPENHPTVGKYIIHGPCIRDTGKHDFTSWYSILPACTWRQVEPSQLWTMCHPPVFLGFLLRGVKGITGGWTTRWKNTVRNFRSKLAEADFCRQANIATTDMLTFLSTRITRIRLYIYIHTHPIYVSFFNLIRLDCYDNKLFHNNSTQ